MKLKRSAKPATAGAVVALGLVGGGLAFAESTGPAGPTPAPGHHVPAAVHPGLSRPGGAGSGAVPGGITGGAAEVVTPAPGNPTSGRVIPATGTPIAHPPGN